MNKMFLSISAALAMGSVGMAFGSLPPQAVQSDDEKLRDAILNSDPMPHEEEEIITSSVTNFEPQSVQFGKPKSKRAMRRSQGRA